MLETKKRDKIAPGSGWRRVSLGYSTRVTEGIGLEPELLAGHYSWRRSCTFR